METGKNPAVLMSKAEREKIFSLFSHNATLTFATIEKKTGLRSNHLVYFLKQLQDEHLLRKSGAEYLLTSKGQTLLPHMKHLTGEESPPLAVVVTAIMDGNRICLLKRAKMPFKGYWCCPGGKLRHGETIMDAAVREAKEETGLDVRFDKFCGFIHEHVKEQGNIKHAFLLFLVRVNVVTGSLAGSQEGKVEWFDLDDAPFDKFVPSDRWMIKNLLRKKAPLHYSVMHENPPGKYSFEGEIY